MCFTPFGFKGGSVFTRWGTVRVGVVPSVTLYISIKAESLNPERKPLCLGQPASSGGHVSPLPEPQGIRVGQCPSPRCWGPNLRPSCLTCKDFT